MSQKIIEVNYDAGRKIDTFSYKDIFHEYYLIYCTLPQNDLFFPLNIFFSIDQRAKTINTSFEKLLILHKRIKEGKNFKSSFSWNGGLELTVGEMHEYKFIVEEIVFHMKGVIDTLVQVAYVSTNFNEFDTTNKLTVDSLGYLLNPRNNQNNTHHYKLIFGDDIDYDSDKTNFLKILNDLFNSFKHCLLHLESHRLIGIDYPTVLSFYAKQNNYSSEIYYHNHNAYHLIMGFQDNLERINKNLQTSRPQLPLTGGFVQ